MITNKIAVIGAPGVGTTDLVNTLGGSMVQKNYNMDDGSMVCLEIWDTPPCQLWTSYNEDDFIEKEYKKLNNPSEPSNRKKLELIFEAQTITQDFINTNMGGLNTAIICYSDDDSLEYVRKYA